MVRAYRIRTACAPQAGRPGPWSAVLPRAIQAAALLLALGPGAAPGDTLYMKDGRPPIECHILRERPDGYTVEVGSTTFEAPSAMIARVVKYANRDTSLVLMGDFFLRDHNYEQAQSYYQRALATTQYKEVVLRRLQLIQQIVVRKEEFAEAEKAFEKKDYRMALDLYLSLRAAHPNDLFTAEINKRAAEASAYVAKEFLDRSRDDDAIFELHRALGFDPLNPHVHALAGELLLRQGKESLAAREYQLALEGDPREATALRGLEKMGKDPQSLRELAMRADSTSLSDLFGERGFRGRVNGILYSALGPGGGKAYDVRFHLGGLTSGGALGAGEIQRIATSLGVAAAYYSPFQFRSSEAVSVLLQAYNAGPGAVALYGGNVPYQETLNYVPRVCDALASIEGGRMPATTYDARMDKYARLFGLPPKLIKAIVKVESDFNPKCVSTADARGLIQLVRVDWNDTMKRLGVNVSYDQHVFDPDWNLFVGCHYLRWLVDSFLPKHFQTEFK